MKWLLACLAGCALAPLGGRGQVLWDGRIGTRMTAQGWSYAALPGTAQEVYTAEAVQLSTQASLLENAGYARVLAPPLLAAEGFNLVVRFRLLAETHTRPERAGFSIILLGADRRGIELGFWRDQVFAQADTPLFTRGEEARRVFDLAPVTAVVSVRGANYTLFVDRQPVLTGPLRDYTAFSGFPDVYETPNFVFLGDDTTSASAEVELHEVALVRAPTVQLEPDGALAWQGVPGQTYTVESSPDLSTWLPASAVTSTNTDFRHPGSLGALPQFFRVVHP
jgi:hypothetical protein